LKFLDSLLTDCLKSISTRNTFYKEMMRVSMIEISIPGYKNLKLKHLVLDYNGTLACDGKLLANVRKGLEALADKLQIHVLTADTFGNVRSELSEISCKLSIIPSENQETYKLNYIKQLGPEVTVCIGNGRNDRLMLKEASLGIAVILEEGAAIEALLASDVICTSIHSALDLLTNPLRLVATLRS